MNITYKYRIYPNAKQAKTLIYQFYLCRQLYNTALEQRKNRYLQTGKSVYYNDQQNQLPELKEEFPEYKQLHSQVIQDVLRRLDKSFKGFFGRIKKHQTAGYPHFKGRDFYNSITYTQSGFSLSDKLILSKVGNIKIKQHRPIKGKVKTCSII